MATSSVGNKIVVRLAGSIVQNSKVDAGELGKFLISFQGLIEDFAKLSQNKLSNKEIKTTSKIYLKKIKKGSAILDFEGSGQKYIGGENPVIEAYGKVVSSVDKINDSPNEARQNLNNEFILPKLRMQTEQRLAEIFTDKYQVGLGIDGKYLYPKSSKRELIQKWVDEDSKMGVSEIQGVMTRLKTDRPQFFTIISATGQKVKCFYEKSEEVKVMGLLKKPISVKGTVIGKIKAMRIKELLGIKSWDYTELSEVGKLKFKSPLKANVLFEDDVWCLNLESLNCSGCGDNYEEALKRLEVSIKDKIESYVKNFKETQLTDKAKSLRKKLSEIVISD